MVPVRNDRAGLAELLRALAAQTRTPDELVVVDGGSVDGTLDELAAWSASPLTVLVEPGATIGAGRNAGIRAAANEWIACTDAGCRPAAEWLAAIDRARGGADLVAGVVLVEGRTDLERVLAVTHYPRVGELGRSSRLLALLHMLFGRRFEPDRVGGAYVAFRRAAWRSAGGFAEDLNAGEDRAFSQAIAKQGLRTVRVPEAAVRWRPPATWRANAAMFIRYSRGDIRIPGRSRHAVRASAWAGASALALKGGWRGRSAVAAGALAYMALPAFRAWQERLPPHAWWRIPVAVAVKDLSQMAGACLGLADETLARRVPGHDR